MKVLKAVSSPHRLNILNLLFDKGSLSYTELMNALKMNPSRDAGRFAYHLKFLLKADLVEADSDSRKYLLTELGKMVIDVADRVEKKAFKPRGMLVRTSHSSMEEFDANKIASSLIREAKMPADLAQKAAKEAESILLKSKTKYLTAPLVRELVNAILVEKGLEDYRHKLTRVGLPVHEVTALIEAKEKSQNATSLISKAGKTVFEEYTILNVFPRDIADAHVSGAIYIDNLGTWLLKPDEIVHDIRFFLQNSLRTGNPMQHYGKQPQNLESALSAIFNALLSSAPEINGMQTLDHFNVFLAPYVRGEEQSKTKESLRSFVLDLNQNVEAAITVDLSIPKLVADEPAIGPLGKTGNCYGDYADESRLITSILVEVVSEESLLKPLLNPRLIVKATKDDLTDEKAKPLLMKAHGLSTEKGILYFADITPRQGKYVTFSGTGCKLEADLTGDWETDTLRTGCLGCATINLPRIAQESEREKSRFFEILKERIELAARALEIKQRSLKQHGRNTLPFLMQSGNGDAYFRIENCSSMVNFAGLKESVEVYCQKSITHEDCKIFLQELVQNLNSYKHKIGRKLGKRFFTSIMTKQEASERLAQLDIEKYGVGKLKFSGTREKPYYSTTKRLTLQTGNSLTLSLELLEIHGKLKALNAGGSLSVIELGTVVHKPEELLGLTGNLIDTQTAEFFTYNRRMAYCSNCAKSWVGVVQKCPSCGAMSTLVTFDRFSDT